jgi:beta-1,4-glucosyltransferase
METFPETNSTQTKAHGEVIPLGGFPILRTTSTELLPLLQKKMQQQQISLFFANTNFIVKCQAHKDVMSNENTIIVNDGIGIDIATWLIHRKTFIENLNGTDFSPLFLQSLGTEARVFLMGAKPGIAQRAAECLRTEYQVNVVGVRNGYDEAKNTSELIDAINSSNANVILIAMGNPYQEEWILRNRQHLNTRVLMGVGALFDFLAGDKARAPALVQKMRLEWFYRLCLEPSRLLRRYTLDIAVFLRLCMQQGKTLGTATNQPVDNS